MESLHQTDVHWFRHATFGLFLHWGPYSALGRGEQVLMRELIDQREYAQAACGWNPQDFDATAWAELAVRSGFRYAVFTTRHHDGYCMWNTHTTDYSSVAQAPGRDFVREYLEAFRQAGLKVGLYYSWNDFRIPALFSGPKNDPEGWSEFREYVHEQLRELTTQYGTIDLIWFDGVWPASARDWRSGDIVKEIRQNQPGILINNRLGFEHAESSALDEFGANESEGGDFSTPEHHILATPGKLWESCQVSTWRLWSHVPGERWRTTSQLLDMLTDASSQGGNLLLNVGPDGEGRIPPEFIERSESIGRWLAVHGEAVYNTSPVNVGESVLFGRQTRCGNTLYLILRFWHGHRLCFQGLKTEVMSATLLTTGAALRVEKNDFGITISGLPEVSPDALFPVIRLELAGEPEAHESFYPGLWGGNPQRLLTWAEARGHSVMADGHQSALPPVSIG